MKSLLSKILACVASVAPFVAIQANADQIINEKTDVSLSVFVPCAAGGAGEMVDLAGSIHTTISATNNGNNVSGTTHTQPQDLSGTGRTTGLKYHESGVVKESFKASLQNGQASTTFVQNFSLIGQGQGDNLTFHETE